MKLERHSANGIEVITLTGSLDAAAAPEARKEIKQIIGEGKNKLVFDLSHLTFLDSSGLSVFVSALKAARADGGDVVLLNLTPNIRALIELMRLHYVFDIFDDEGAAVAKLRG
ncbi:MAG: STAS domain-containing protein [Nitrospirota bacterium]|nr:MAG: STAS domain-containing protein [Nitrospirota bacterium]